MRFTGNSRIAVNSTGTSGKIVKRFGGQDVSDVTPEMMEAFRLAFRKIGVDLYGISSYEFRDAISIGLADTITISRAQHEALMAAAKSLAEFRTSHPAVAALRAAGILHSVRCDETGSCPTCPACLGPDYAARAAQKR